jgi:hypothetical protein
VCGGGRLGCVGVRLGFVGEEDWGVCGSRIGVCGRLWFVLETEIVLCEHRVVYWRKFGVRIEKDLRK